MTQRIIYAKPNGAIGVLVPAPEWQGTLEQLAEKDVPAGCPWHIVTTDALPASRNWRNAWENNSGVVGVDLEKAKQCHQNLMVTKMYERITPDVFGEKDTSTTKAEILAIDFNAITSLEALYNTWPSSIELRSGGRSYHMYATPQE